MFLLDLILPRGCFSCKDVPKIDESKLLLATTIGFAGIASELRPFEDLSEINRKHREVLRELENRLETFKNKKEDNKMCKSGDKDYWQVGDEVFCMKYGKGVIDLRDTDTCLIRTRFKDNEYCTYYTNGKICIGANVSRTLFHIGAITFDEQNRPIANNYDYIPERTPKVQVTKLPHEFVKGEEVLCKQYNNNTWGKTSFYGFDTKYRPSAYEGFVPMVKIGNGGHNAQVIPFIGNEHMEGAKITCNSGKVPYDYVFPEIKLKEEPFRKVKLGDTVYRLHEGEYVKGRCIEINDRAGLVDVETEKETSYKRALSNSWEYNFLGELHGQESLGQVLFWKKPNNQEHEFKPFDKVVVRNKPFQWRAQIFSNMDKNKFICINGTYEYCLPFEGNEHLLGTFKDLEE